MTVVTRLHYSNAKKIDEKFFLRYVILLRFKGGFAEDENNILCTDFEFSTHQENLEVIDKNNIVHKGFFFGHYFNNMKDAIIDFKERCKKESIDEMI